jgi:hypothetical protein
MLVMGAVFFLPGATMFGSWQPYVSALAFMLGVVHIGQYFWFKRRERTDAYAGHFIAVIRPM